MKKLFILIAFFATISFVYSNNNESNILKACSATCTGGSCETDGPGKCGCSNSGAPFCGHSMEHVGDIPLDILLNVSASPEQIEFQNRFAEMLNINNNSEAWNIYKSAVSIEYEMIKNGHLSSNSLIDEINAFNNLSEIEKKLIVDFK